MEYGAKSGRNEESSCESTRVSLDVMWRLSGLTPDGAEPISPAQLLRGERKPGKRIPPFSVDHGCC